MPAPHFRQVGDSTSYGLEARSLRVMFAAFGECRNITTRPDSLMKSVETAARLLFPVKPALYEPTGLRSRQLRITRASTRTSTTSIRLRLSNITSQCWTTPSKREERQDAAIIEGPDDYAALLRDRKS